MQVHHFNGLGGVKVLIDALKYYDQAYKDIVWIKSCLKKILLILELFNSTDLLSIKLISDNVVRIDSIFLE